MSRTLFWYIFWDLLRIFAMTSLVLTAIMSFGGLLRPLTEHGLGPGQVAKMLTYTLPAMWTYALPVAALFATTMVYGRLGADNEITACRAAGVSAISIATPAIVLGAVIMTCSFGFLFFVVPRFSLKVEQIIYSNIAQLVQGQIERSHRIQLDQPGGRPLAIFAQEAQVLPAPSDRPRDQVVRLTAPVFVTYEAGDRDNRTRIPTPQDFYMARSATAYISQDETGDLYLQAQLDGGMKLPRRTQRTADSAARGGETIQASVENTTFYSDAMESPVRENTKFMELRRLRQLLAQPEKSRRLRKLLNEFVRDDQQRTYLQSLQSALVDEGFAQLETGEEPGLETAGERYVLERGGANVEIKNGRLVIGSMEGVPPQRLPRLRQVRGGQDVLSVTARQVSLSALPVLAPSRARERTGPDQRRFAIEVELDEATVTAAAAVTPRSRFQRTFTVPMPADLVAMARKKVADYSAAVAGSESRVMQLKRNWTKLTNSITSEIYARASFSVGCLVLVMVGCALGMMFRSGNFLSAFAVSVIPAMLSILLIIAGQHTCENVPWDITNFNNPLKFGLWMIWTGNILVAALAGVLLVRLQRQ